jgi:hypothetical protein
LEQTQFLNGEESDANDEKGTSHYVMTFVKGARCRDE